MLARFTKKRKGTDLGEDELIKVDLPWLARRAAGCSRAVAANVFRSGPEIASAGEIVRWEDVERAGSKRTSVER